MGSVQSLGMPSSNDRKPESEKDWFDKLPKKVRIALLMLFTVSVTAFFSLTGLHALRTGEYSNYAGYKVSAVGSFFWAAFWLVITILLFAAYLGWFKGKDDSPE
jgi:hypothetical protein